MMESGWNTLVFPAIKQPEDCILRHYTRKLTRKNLVAIYNAYIRPILEYAAIVMTNMTLADEEKLEDLHRSGIRAITGCKVGTSHLELYRNWMNPG